MGRAEGGAGAVRSGERWGRGARSGWGAVRARRADRAYSGAMRTYPGVAWGLRPRPQGHFDPGGGPRVFFWFVMRIGLFILT